MAGSDQATQKTFTWRGTERVVVAVEGLTETVKCEQKSGGSKGHLVDECKGPEAGACGGYLRKPLWLEKIEEEHMRRRGPGRGWARTRGPCRSFQGRCLLL